jgi:hypothetical protein
MVRVVERREVASGEEMIFEFKVYRSPKDGRTVLGYMRPRGIIVNKNTVQWIGTSFGVPVSDAFRETLSLLENVDAAILWVNDPNGCFPPDIRPVTA